MSIEVIQVITTAAVSILVGGGGVFAFLTSKQKNKQIEHESAVSEWKELYDEMKTRLDEQEKVNDKLKTELFEIKQHLTQLNNELQNYKKYDGYINELEKYIDHLLHTSKSLITDEAYKNLCLKRPQKIITTDLLGFENHYKE